MSWNVERITSVAVQSAPIDYGAFEAIGLSEIDHAAVLDVGCFDGYNTMLKFAPYGNIARVVGIDPCEDRIEQARESCTDKRFAWEVADAESYNAEDESFDVIYFSHSFQHVRSKEQTLDNMYNLLKPGGFVVIKTIDDSLIISSPDPNESVRKAIEFYAENVRPFTPHTGTTDRFNGKKCPALLLSAGFDAVRLKILYTDTMGKTLEQRMNLFERLTYFRNKVAPEAGHEADVRMHELLDEWKQLFTEDAYYFASPTVVALARKPYAPQKPAPADYRGPWFEAACALQESEHIEQVGPWRLSAMSESCLGEVMAIENKAFPSPWTPLAYALELRYNHDASYVVARSDEGVLCGYVGTWVMDDVAYITRVAVDDAYKRKGLGRALIHHACARASAKGCKQMRLTVRESNAAARAFYRILGFTECATSPMYYSDPIEDGTILALAL